MDGILHGSAQSQTKNRCKYLEKRKRRGKHGNMRLSHGLLKEEVPKATRMLKDGKSPGVCNIPADILKHGKNSSIILQHYCAAVDSVNLAFTRWQATSAYPGRYFR